MGKKKCTNIPAMQCGDCILTENYDKAEEFNKAFLKFATIDTSNAGLPDIAYKTNSRLNSINITQAETLDILKSLDTSKATGPDGISCKMLKETGFTPGDSTVHQLVYLYNTFCKALNDKKDVRIVFCDQSKAFDRVWHQGLLKKLECIGVTGDLSRWFQSYLHNREQRRR